MDRVVEDRDQDLAAQLVSQRIKALREELGSVLPSDDKLTDVVHGQPRTELIAGRRGVYLDRATGQRAVGQYPLGEDALATVIRRLPGHGKIAGRIDANLRAHRYRRRSGDQYFRALRSHAQQLPRLQELNP